MIHLFLHPSSVFAAIFSLCLLMVSSPGAHGQTSQKIVFLGDSITAGYGLKKEDAYPAIIKQLAAADGHRLQVLNAGLSGDTTRGGLRRIAVLAKRPIDILVIALGGNDGLRGIAPKVSQANLEAIIDRVRKTQPDTRILVAGMQMPENMGKDYTDAFRKVFAQVAANKNTHALPFLLEGVATNPSLNLPDGIHPNVKGQTIVAAHVYKTLAPLLK
jgi:acyl-CoA thioesterase-1